MLIHSEKTLKTIFTLISIVFFISSCSNQQIASESSVRLRIHDIQGCAHVSPLVGKLVNGISGIVTSKTPDGFYMQDDQPDELDCSSEAIFVFTDTFTEVLPGDQVEVSGIVNEFFPGSEKDLNLSITEIKVRHYTVKSRENDLPGAVIIGMNGRVIPDQLIDDDGLKIFDEELDGIDFYESLESMLVQVESGIVVGPRNSYNEVAIIPAELISRNLVSAESSLLQQKDDPNPERILLNLNDSNRDQVNVGDELIHPVQGIMDYSYGNYKINTFGKVEFSENDSIVFPLQENEHLLSVASLNTENLSRFDEDIKFSKIAKIIVETLNSPKIVILHEVMDDSGSADDGVVAADRTIERVINSITIQHGPAYSYVSINPIDGEDGGIPGGNIRSVILYRAESGFQLVTDVVKKPLKTNPDRIETSSFTFEGARKPVTALFEQNGHKFLIIAAHLTSRSADSPLFGNQQPITKPEEEKRIQQASDICEFVENFIIHNPDTRVIVAGDLNDDPWSATLHELTISNLYDMGSLVDPAERFSYILDGNGIQLDYILASRLENAQDQFTIMHINSIFDYSIQSSDHDPVFGLVDLR